MAHQLLSLVFAGQVTEFPDQLVTLRLGNEAGRRNRIDEQLQLRQLEFTAGHEKSIVVTLDGYDVIAFFYQHVNVVFHRLPGSIGAGLRKNLHQFVGSW